MTEFYSTGTVAVTNGIVDFVGTGTTWLPANVKAGDVMNVAGRVMVIEEITDTTHGKFATPYPGSTASGQAYAVVKTSAAWGTNREIAVNTAELVQLLTTGQFFEWVIALSAEDGVISASPGVVTKPVPRDVTVEDIEMFLKAASDSGNVVTDVLINEISVLSTPLTTNQGENFSSAAGTTPYVLTQANWDKGDILRIDFLTAGSNAAGAAITITGRRRN